MYTVPRIYAGSSKLSDRQLQAWLQGIRGIALKWPNRERRVRHMTQLMDTSGWISFFTSSLLSSLVTTMITKDLVRYSCSTLHHQTAAGSAG